MHSFYNLLRCVSIAVVIAHCVYGQKVNYHPFKHYDDRVQLFSNSPQITSDDIIMLGNSLTEFGGNWGTLLNAEHVINRGIAGDTAMGIYHRLSQILPRKPKAIFLMVGVNDMSHGLSPQKVVELCKKPIDRILNESPETKLFVQSCLPYCESFGNWKTLLGRSAEIPVINELLKQYCEQKGVEYIDLYPHFLRKGTNQMRKELSKDGLHLTPIGYKVWSFILNKYVQALQTQPDEP